MEQGKKINTTPQMVFCLQMGSSKEKWGKKIQGQGETLYGFQTSEQVRSMEGSPVWGREWPELGGAAGSSSESPLSTLRALRVGCTHGRGLPSGGKESRDHRPQWQMGLMAKCIVGTSLPMAM